MPKHAPDEAPDEIPTPTGELAYEAPAELADEPASGGGRPPRSIALKLAAVALVALVIGGGLLAYRAHHRRKVVEAALTQADALLRLDTAAGYRQAATLLEPIAQLDPLQGASVRAFALAMLFSDYRQAEAEPEVENLLITPMRAENVPPYAQLAAAAVALGRKEAGTATTAVARAGSGPWPLVLQARVAFLAGNVEAALQPAAAAAAEGAFAPGLALHGDALRRLRRDQGAARAAYEAALAASPAHARATFGLAKLALAGDAPAEEAISALRRLVDDREGTPAVERARAALHLAALHLRAGDHTSADAALDMAGLDPASRAWAGRAAIVAADHRGPYRAVQGAPAPLQTPSDDDPGELNPNPPPPPPPPPAPAVTTTKKPSKKAIAAAKKAATKKAALKKGASAKAAKKAAAKKDKKKSTRP
jgi:hypothetical protein